MSSTEHYEPPANGWRTFIIVWVTQSLSVFGSALTFFAVTIYLTQVLFPAESQKGELAAALAAIGIAFGVPTMVFAPIAGAWADRHDRKRTMLTMDYVLGFLSLIVMVLMATHLMQFWMLLVLVVAFASFGSFHSSAFDTSYAMLVPEKQLPRANGMMQTIWSLSGILSPGIAAFLISLPDLSRQGLVPGGVGAWLASLADGTPVAISIDAITFFIAATTVLFLTIPSPKRSDLRNESGKMEKSLWADVKEGAQYIWHRRPLLWLLGTFTAINFVGSLTGTIQPLLVKFDLVGDWSARGFTFTTALALLGTIAGVGGLLGGIIISTWGGLKKKRIYGVVVPIMFSGLATMIFGLSPFIYLTAAMAFIIEGLIPFMNAHSQAIWQTQTPRELQGRVFSVRRVIAQFTWPLGAVIAGFVGGTFDPGIVMAMLGGALVVFCIGQLFNPYLRRVEDKDYLEEFAARHVVARQEEQDSKQAPVAEAQIEAPLVPAGRAEK